jgi:hypothetical protein
MRQVIEFIIGKLSVSNQELFEIIFSILLSLAIALIISQIYKFTHRGLNYELSFMKTLVLLAPIVASVMLFIRGDLVLSLGLIGSLSIIRFRTPIKDTRDMVFLFWVIAVGLGCGTYNWMIVIITAIIMTVIMFVLHFVSYGVMQSKEFILVVSGFSALKTKELGTVISKYAQDIVIRSQETEDELWEVVYELRFDRLIDNREENLVGELRNVESVRKVSLLAPQTVLPA